MNLNKISDSALLSEYNRRFEIPLGDVISSSDDTARHLRPLYNEDRDIEQFYIVFLNARNAIISTKLMFRGSLMSSSVHIREIIKECLKQEAAAVILSHNHPSGNNNPSGNDRSITKEIVKACKVMGITVHDHIIICREKFYSFADEGRI